MKAKKFKFRFLIFFFFLFLIDLFQLDYFAICISNCFLQLAPVTALRTDPKFHWFYLKLIIILRKQIVSRPALFATSLEEAAVKELQSAATAADASSSKVSSKAGERKRWVSVLAAQSQFWSRPLSTLEKLMLEDAERKVRDTLPFLSLPPRFLCPFFSQFWF